MKTETDNRAENQAKAQCESIVAMTRALKRESAAEDYANGCPLPNARQMVYDEDGSPEIEMDEQEVRERLAELISNETIQPDDFTFDVDEAEQTIQEDPLSIQVRSGWYTPGSQDKFDTAPEEFEILLCTGGPACRIVGDLDGYAQPSRPRIQYQDWGTPWTEYFPTDEECEALEVYCQQFYFGE